jgi:hypothetical protein
MNCPLKRGVFSGRVVARAQTLNLFADTLEVIKTAVAAEYI